MANTGSLWLFIELLCELRQKLSLFAYQESTIFLRMCRMQFEHRGLSCTLGFLDDACLKVLCIFLLFMNIYYML